MSKSKKVRKTDCPNCGRDYTKEDDGYKVYLVTEDGYTGVGPQGSCAGINSLAAFMARIMPDACFVVCEESVSDFHGVHGPHKFPDDEHPGRYQITECGCVVSATDDKIEAQCRVACLNLLTDSNWYLYDAVEEIEFQEPLCHTVEADFMADPDRRGETPGCGAYVTYPTPVGPGAGAVKENAPCFDSCSAIAR